MAKTEIVTPSGTTVEFKSKKAMLKTVGYAFLNESDEPMTVRQLYYRFVAADYLENKESQYTYLGEAIKEARMEGMIPWDWIEDRTRGTDAGDRARVSRSDYFDNRLQWLKEAPESYQRPRWEGQNTYVEVWVEKEALSGVFASVCSELGVVSFANRGYTSITMLKEAADRIGGVDAEERVVLYFGDFDPSGQDIERNIREKLVNDFGVDVEVRRVALTREQIDERELPPQPAKSSDSRYGDFVEEHGDLAVELDALEPEALRDMVREEVTALFDEDRHEDMLESQREDRQWLEARVAEVLD